METIRKRPVGKLSTVKRNSYGTELTIMEVTMLEPTMFSIIAKAENDEIQKKAERRIKLNNQRTRNSSDRETKLVHGPALSGMIRSLLMRLTITYSH